MPNNSKVLTIISHLIVTIVISILCSLGSWQIARYEDKKERVIQISERQAQGVIEHRMLTTLNLSDVRVDLY